MLPLVMRYATLALRTLARLDSPKDVILETKHYLKVAEMSIGNTKFSSGKLWLAQ